MRASSADRDRAIEVLKASFAEGRLTKDELDERVGQALLARAFAELMALTVDLPVGPFGRLPAHRVTPTLPRRNRLAVLTLTLCLLPVLTVVIAAFIGSVDLSGPERLRARDS
jgi:hypothetical protein